MSPETPSFTVIGVTRDRPALLADALATVAAQTHRPLEVRVADDGDAPAQHAAEGPGLLEVTWIVSDARQAAASRNLAAAGARGDVLAFLDDDDRWRTDHLAGLAGAFADPATGLAYRDSVVLRESVDDAGRRVELERRTIAHDWDPALMRHDDFVPPSAFAVRRGLFERLGGFDEGFRYSEDWDFLMRAAAHTTPRRVPGATVEVRLREAGNASSERGPERQECLDLLAARHGLPPLEIKTFWEVALAVGAAGSPS